MTVASNTDLSRRQFLQTGAAAALACAPSFARQGWSADAVDPYRGFKTGIQSYSLRAFKTDRALEMTKQLGLKYWESYRDHLPISAVPAQIAEQKERVSHAGIQVIAFGVISLDANESKTREVFEFARAMGIQSLSADPKSDEDTLRLLDKLVDEYKIKIAIHNHGPRSRYDKIDDVVKVIKDHHPGIGACIDTGHYLRSGENPVEAIERFKDRVYGVHLKDVKDARVFKILGEGDLDVLGCLKALKKQNYQYCLALEYEENKENPMHDIEICLQNLRKAMQQLG